MRDLFEKGMLFFDGHHSTHRDLSRSGYSLRGYRLNSLRVGDHKGVTGGVRHLLRECGVGGRFDQLTGQPALRVFHVHAAVPRVWGTVAHTGNLKRLVVHIGDVPRLVHNEDRISRGDRIEQVGGELCHHWRSARWVDSECDDPAPFRQCALVSLKLPYDRVKRVIRQRKIC